MQQKTNPHNPISELGILQRFVPIIWKHSMRYPVLFIGIAFVIIAAQAFVVIIPVFLQRLVDAFTQISPSALSPTQFVIRYVLPIAGLRLASWLTWRVSGFMASELQPKVMRDLVSYANHVILDHSYRFFSDHFTGSLVRRVQSFATSYRDVMETFWWSLLPMSVSVSLGVGMLAWRQPILGITVLVWVALLLGSNLLMSRMKLVYDKARAAKHTTITGTVSDAIANATNISLFTARKEEESRLAKLMEEWRRLTVKGWRIGETGMTIQNISNFFCEMIVMSYVVLQWRAGLMTLGDIVYVQGVLVVLFGNTYEIGRLIRRLYEASSDAHEMLDILDLTPEIRDARNAKPLVVKRGEIVFEHVDFNYKKGQPVLQDFALSIKSKEKVALVGASGSGKSTVTKLLFRFFDVDHGKILIDGQEIAKVTQDSLRQSIALVPQDPVLFHRSLLDNIRYGRRDATEEEVIEAAKLAHCHEFITHFPEGYATLVGERGIKLSGGERQRIAIARAILKDAPMLVLDEATSSLDSESEMYIQDALKHLMRDKTVIVIAHRLSTVMEMDRIIVMRDGKVIDEGTHEALKSGGGVYEKLWNIQAGSFQEA